MNKATHQTPEQWSKENTIPCDYTAMLHIKTAQIDLLKTLLLIKGFNKNTILENALSMFEEEFKHNISKLETWKDFINHDLI